MKEKIKKIIKPFLAVIIAGFIVSVLYIGLANQDIEKKLKEEVKLPETFGSDYSDLESMIYDLEWRIDDLESQISDLEWRIDDNESNISDLESRIDDLESSISRFKSCLRNWLLGVSSIVDDLWYCAGKLP